MQHQIISRFYLWQRTGFDFPAFLLSKDVTGFTQRAGNNGLDARRVDQIAAIGGKRGNVMIAAVHGRAHQVVEASINQHKVTASHLLHAPHLRHQHASFGDQETTRLNLQLHRMAQMSGDAVTRGAPQAVIVIRVDRLFPFAVRDRKPSPGGDRLQILTKIDNLTHHCATDLLKMAIIHAGPDMHVNAHQLEVVAL